MSANLINLLPREDTRSLRREYLLRVVVVGVVALTVVIIINAALLIPSFLYEQQEIQTYTRGLNQFAARSISEEKELNDHLNALSAQASFISNLSSVVTSSATIRTILAVPRTNIVVTGFVFTAPNDKGAGTLQIRGVAGTREALRTYSSALEAVPFVAAGDLPISDYAQATNIPFSDNLTLSFKKP